MALFMDFTININRDRHSQYFITFPGTSYTYIRQGYNIERCLSLFAIDPVYFLGTKFEAFKSRGKGELFSHDMEDIIFVLEHRSTIDRDIFGAPNDIKFYLATEFQKILQHPELENTLPGLLDDDSATEMVLGRMHFIASQGQL